MDVTIFLDIITAIVFLIGAYLVFFMFYVRKKNRETERYIKCLEAENDDLACEVSSLKQEIENQRKRFNTTVRLMQ